MPKAKTLRNVGLIVVALFTINCAVMWLVLARPFGG
jgi:hypothetical protein